MRRPAILAALLSLGAFVVPSCGDTSSPDAGGTSQTLSPPPSLAKCKEYRHIDAPKCGAGSANFTTHVWSLAFSPSGGQLATASDDGVVEIWKMTGAVPTKTSTMLPTSGQAFVAYSPDGRLFVEGAHMGELRLYDASTFTLLANLAGHLDDIKGVAFTADSEHLWVLDTNGRLTRHDVGGGAAPALTVEMGVHGLALDVSPVATPTSQWLAVGFTNGVGNIVDLSIPTAPLLTNITVTADGLAASMMSFSPDGTTLAAGGSDGIVGFWTIPPPANGERSSGTIPINDSRGVPLWITGVKYSPDGKSLLVSAGYVGGEWTLAIWDPVARTQRASVVPTYEPFTVAWAPSQGIIAAGEGSCGQIIVCSDD